MMAEGLEEASKHAAVETTATAKATVFGIKLLGALQGLFAFLTLIYAVWTVASRNKVNQATKEKYGEEAEKREALDTKVAQIEKLVDGFQKVFEENAVLREDIEVLKLHAAESERRGERAEIRADNDRQDLRARMSRTKMKLLNKEKSVRAQLAKNDVRVLEIEVNDVLHAGEIKEQNETIKSLQETIETLQQRLKSYPGWAPGGSGDGSTASARARGGRAPSSRRQPGGQGETRPL